MSEVIDLSQYFTAVKRFNMNEGLKAVDIVSGRFLDPEQRYLIDDIMRIGKKNRASHVVMVLNEGDTVWEDGWEPTCIYYVLPFEDVNAYIARLGADGVCLMKEIK